MLKGTSEIDVLVQMSGFFLTKNGVEAETETVRGVF